MICLTRALTLIIAITVFVHALCGQEGARDNLRRVDFATDPNWDAFRNRQVQDPPPITKQNFGYRTTNHAGGKKPGEIGGRIQRSATPASYAVPLSTPKTFNDRITASGRFSVTWDDNGNGVWLGFFNANQTRGWRANNSLCFRLDGNGSKYWVFYEYGTRHWLSGGGGCFEGDAYQKTKTKPFPSDGTPHDWSITYDPDANKGDGQMTFVLDGKAYELPLAPGHKKDGATFDRFGIVNQQTTGGSIDAWFDDLVIDAKEYNFDEDPKWEGRGNRVEFADRVKRPYQDFGFSPQTPRAGGKPGEIGGVLWRGEGPAFYADRVGPLSLDDELYASGTIAFMGAGSDSGTCIGWFDSASKKANSKADGHEPQANALGIVIEGPSRIGHYFRPTYGVAGGEGATTDAGPIIRPDAQVHRWSIRYSPKANNGHGQILVTLDDQTVKQDLSESHRAKGATFDRFGLYNVAVGGNQVVLWIDDLTYTAARAK
jgi:hypothetical protein